MSNSLFMGKNGFIWWFGRVENNGDPLGLGRCQVRIDGWHNASDGEQAIPVVALPWAYPITGLDNAAIGGVGKSVVGPQRGTRIFGFFLDGVTGQQPVMLGTVPGESVSSFSGEIPYGSTITQPNVNSGLVGAGGYEREGDCSVGYAVDTSRANMEIPDPRKIIINPSDWSLPFTGFVSSAYSECAAGPEGRVHNGVDICPAGFYLQHSAGSPHLAGRLRGVTGLPVYAAANGIVKLIWTKNKGQGGVSTNYDATGHGSRSYGNAIAIEHDLSGQKFVTIYAHLGSAQDAASDMPNTGVMVNVGDTVSKGQQIGTCGRTHNWDTLTHLHFEIRYGAGLPKNPNHINPGRVFPQLAHRHHAFRSWADSQASYAALPPYNPSEAPVIALKGPE